MIYKVKQPPEDFKPNYWFKTEYFNLWQNLSSPVMQCANNVEVILNFLIPSCSCGNYTYNRFFSTHQSVGSSYLSFNQFGISQ